MKITTAKEQNMSQDPYMPQKTYRVRKVGDLNPAQLYNPPRSKTFGNLMWALNHLRRLRIAGATESELWVGTITWRKLTAEEIEKMKEEV